MTALAIDRDDPRKADATGLLRASHALMQSLFPAESNHFLSVDALCGPDIRFFTARAGGRAVGRAVGCAALALKQGYGEVKSMYVDEAARGTGAGAALLARVEAEARAAGLTLLRLETGDTLHAAHRLYERAGFTRCGPFGDYEDGPHSLFMEKALT